MWLLRKESSATTHTNSASEASTKSDLESGPEQSTSSADAEKVERASGCGIRRLCLGKGQVFWLLAIAGFGLSISALVTQAYWLLASSLLLLGLSGFSSITLGGDIFQLSALKDTVKQFQQENKVLERQNNDLEAKVQELSSVAAALQQVEQQLGEDVETVQGLVRELECMNSVQLAAAMLNLFFAADTARAGSVSGTYVDMVLHGLGAMWQLVPEMAPGKPRHTRLLQTLRRCGLSYEQFVVLVEATLDGETALLRKELEALARGHGGAEGVVDLEIRDSAVSFSSEETSSDAEEEALAPCWTVGPLSIWSKSHAVFLGALLLSAGLVFHAMASFFVVNFVCSLVDFGLAGSLTAYGKLVAVRAALQEELLKYRSENERLSDANKELGERVASLAKLQRGLQALQSQFRGCAVAARSAVQRSNTSVKMAAITALNHLFVRTDTASSGQLEANQIEEFAAGAALIFRHVEAVDARAIAEHVKGGKLQIGQIKELVEFALARRNEAVLPGVDGVGA